MSKKSAEEVMEELSRLKRISDSRDYKNWFLAGLAHGRKEAEKLVESLDYVLAYSEDLFSDAQIALESYKRKVGEK